MRILGINEKLKTDSCEGKWLIGSIGRTEWESEAGIQPPMHSGNKQINCIKAGYDKVNFDQATVFRIATPRLPDSYGDLSFLVP
jgi:hypothetical protein